MPGRIKPAHGAHNHPHHHDHLKPRPHLALHRRQEPPPPTPSVTATPNQDAPPPSSIFDNQAPDAKSFVLNKQTIIWLCVISVIVLATLITVTCLLCKCKRKRKGSDGKEVVTRHANGHRWHPSLEIKDGRNEFQAWNRHAPPLTEQGEPVRMETFGSSNSRTPLRPQGASAVMEPVVVDYATGGKKASRYYSNLNAGASGRQSWWKRISQIGRAY